MAFQEQQIFQHRENSTNAASVYSPGSGETVIIKTIIACNTSGSAATLDIYHDDDGSTYDESTALIWQYNIPLTGGVTILENIMMNDSSGNLAMKSSVANAITVSGYGAIIT